MRNTFLIIVGGVGLLGLLGFFLFVFLRSIVTVFSDWRLGRDGEAVRRESDRQRNQLKEQNASRLENGCQHEWGGLIRAFPANACRHCGLEQQLPNGVCDHVWRVKLGHVPSSYCEKCNKLFRPPDSAL